MGTNYYLHSKNEKCSHCGSVVNPPKHIGKSSGGWCFSLHIIPDIGIYNLHDWKGVWSHPEVLIKNEYGEIVSPEGMLEVITARACTLKNRPLGGGYEEGPNGLIRHLIDGRFCVGHGEGTWDLINGEFS